LPSFGRPSLARIPVLELVVFRGFFTGLQAFRFLFQKPVRTHAKRNTEKVKDGKH